jgi:hypothetical protein
LCVFARNWWKKRVAERLRLLNIFWSLLNFILYTESYLLGDNFLKKQYCMCLARVSLPFTTLAKLSGVPITNSPERCSWIFYSSYPSPPQKKMTLIICYHCGSGMILMDPGQCPSNKSRPWSKGGI